MTTLTDIKRMWQVHRRARFPAEARGRDIDGVDLARLDSLAAGCISSFLDDLGELDPKKARLLEDIAGQLQRVVPEMEASMRSYYENLAALIAAVLACLSESRH